MFVLLRFICLFNLSGEMLTKRKREKENLPSPGSLLKSPVPGQGEARTLGNPLGLL